MGTKRLKNYSSFYKHLYRFSNFCLSLGIIKISISLCFLCFFSITIVGSTLFSWLIQYEYNYQSHFHQLFPIMILLFIALIFVGIGLITHYFCLNKVVIYITHEGYYSTLTVQSIDGYVFFKNLQLSLIEEVEIAREGPLTSVVSVYYENAVMPIFAILHNPGAHTLKKTITYWKLTYPSM